MLASTRPNQGKRERRGIVLVLILGVLGLMAVIGVAFATFSGQSRISARNFAQSVNQPQRDELMDYALSQLICDTPTSGRRFAATAWPATCTAMTPTSTATLPRVPTAPSCPPDNDPYFYITGVTAGTGTLYILTTNIPANEPGVLRLQLHPLDIRVYVQRHT